MNGLTVKGSSYDDALKKALEEAKLPEAALDVRSVGGLGERIDDRDDGLDDQSVTLQVMVKPEYVAEKAREHLLKMLALMNLKGAQIQTVFDADHIKMKMSAQNSAILIGRNGQTLEALQHLINRMATPPGLGAPYISLDVEDYRERRVQQLERIARRAAREALETREEVVLEPMSAADRKIIHIALRSNHTVSTFSRGEEGERCVVVVAAPNAR